MKGLGAWDWGLAIVASLLVAQALCEPVRCRSFSRDGTQLTLSLRAGDRITQSLTCERVR